MNIERSVGDGQEGFHEQGYLDTVWKRKAIGPDDCYQDDFSYGQAILLNEDPLFHQQYGRMLDLRYKAQREKDEDLCADQGFTFGLEKIISEKEISQIPFKENRKIELSGRLVPTQTLPAMLETNAERKVILALRNTEALADEKSSNDSSNTGETDSKNPTKDKSNKSIDFSSHKQRSIEVEDKSTETIHYELLCLATSAEGPQTVESIYQEIPAESGEPKNIIPDILKNRPNKVLLNPLSSSNARDITRIKQNPVIHDSFHTASYFFDNSKHEEIEKKLGKFKQEDQSDTRLLQGKINLRYKSIYEDELSSETDQRTSVSSNDSYCKTVENSILEKNLESEVTKEDLEVQKSAELHLNYESNHKGQRSRSVQGFSSSDTVMVLMSRTAPSPATSFRSTPLPARGREAPAPPPLNFESEHKFSQQWPAVNDEDTWWRESLRRASADHRARTISYVQARSSSPNYKMKSVSTMMNTQGIISLMSGRHSVSGSNANSLPNTFFNAHPHFESEQLLSKAPTFDHLSFHPPLPIIMQGSISLDVQGKIYPV